jgi:hypothetical protein
VRCSFFFCSPGRSVKSEEKKHRCGCGWSVGRTHASDAVRCDVRVSAHVAGLYRTRVYKGWGYLCYLSAYVAMSRSPCPDQDTPSGTGTYLLSHGRCYIVVLLSAVGRLVSGPAGHTPSYEFAFVGGAETDWLLFGTAFFSFCLVASGRGLGRM